MADNPQSTEDRSALIHCPVAGVVMGFQKFETVETLYNGFEIKLEVVTTKGDLKFADFGGQMMVVEFKNKQGNGRCFSGYVVEMARITGNIGEKTGELFSYRIKLAPWSWFLGLRGDCRIFDSKDLSSPNSVKDILKKVFSDAGFSSDYKPNSLSESYAELNYVVQYNESDLTFARRMMEREGIYHFFEHTADGHAMKLADAPSCHETVSGYEKIPYRNPSEPSAVESVRGWIRRHAVRTGKVVNRDYDPTDPNKNLEKTKTDKGDGSQAEHEWYEYPGQYAEPAAGERYVKARIAEHQCLSEVIEGKSNAIGIVPGYYFELEDHPATAENSKYMVISAKFKAEGDTDAWDTKTNACKCHKFDVVFEAIPQQVRYHPPRKTPVPRVVGPHTAVVVGQSGEEITTDEFGRIKVQFHWDRVGKNDQDSSCWVRVSQTWAHGGWGSQSIPRHGMEVIVEYIDADLERPIVTGCVYNGKNKPPFELPGNATQSGLKSQSSKEGSADNFNEIRLEDKKDEELFFIQAEKDAERVVKNNDVQKIGLETSDPGDQTIEIHNDRTVTLNEGNEAFTVKKGDQTVKVETGSQTIDVKKKILITAGDEIKLETGSASILMKKDGTITIKGKDITIDGSGNVTVKAGMNAVLKGGANVDVKAGGSLTAKGSTGTFDGGGSCTIKGAIVNIN